MGKAKYEGTIKFVSQRLQNSISVSVLQEIAALWDVGKTKESVMITKGISKQIKEGLKGSQLLTP